MKLKRLSGRCFDQLRPFIIRRFSSHAEGSVLVKAGETCVLCTASISKKELPSFVKHGQGWLSAQYSMLPGSTNPRFEREVDLGRQKGRTQEIQRLIGRSLRAVIDMKVLSGLLISIDCDVIKADGGSRCASITGSWIALSDAINFLIKNEVIKINPIIDSVAAVSVGIVGKKVLLDLDYQEDLISETDMNVVMTGNGSFVEIQGTAEHSTFSRKQLNKILDMAEKGIKDLLIKQEQICEQLILNSLKDKDFEIF